MLNKFNTRKLDGFVFKFNTNASSGYEKTKPPKGQIYSARVIRRPDGTRKF